jgi:hypothetical protein
MASTTFARRLAHVETIQQQDSASNAFNKLTRTFAAQMLALKEYRSKGEQPKAEVPSARPYRIPRGLIMVYVDNAGRLEKAQDCL